jgi:glycosyltransferase involved in cell wall biosynthesis
MATYNGSSYLSEQLDSILSQLHAEDELIISDDHSTDDTRSIIARYKDKRVTQIMNTGKPGHVWNFGNAMAHATGEFIALSDQDDIWVENRMERMLDLLQRQPRYSLVVGDVIEFDEDGVRATQRRLGPSPRNRLLLLFRIFLGRAKYFGSAFLFRRDLTRFVLPIPYYIEAHDIWIALNACVRGNIMHLDEPTLMRRLHGMNLTPLQHRNLWKVMMSRLGYFAGMLQSTFR